MKKQNVFEILKQRGYVYDTSDEVGLKLALEQPVAMYIGFDPSAQSLHLGHLLLLMAMHYFQEYGHKVIFLIGGGTGLVGDPSGKSTQRNLVTREFIEENAVVLKKQVEDLGLLRFSGENAATMVNNVEWLGEFKFLDDFLIKIARYFSVNELVSMRTFSDRLSENRPLSLLEFCYPALQAWDYLELYKRHKCKLQAGGQDQWANILAGVDLIRKSEDGANVFALTFPLLTTADGVKMGKTEKGPVWLDVNRTSAFDFYQYIVKTPDDMVPTLFKLFTFLPLEEIDLIIKSPKEAQKRLAYEVTKLIHGDAAAKEAQNAENIPEAKLKDSGLNIVEVLVSSGCLPSNSEAKRRIQQGGVYVGEEKVENVDFLIKSECIVKYGKGKLLKIIKP